MTVRELIAHLSTFTPDALVVCTRCSDVMTFETDEVKQGRVLFKDGDPKMHDWHTLLSEHDEATMDPLLRGNVRTVVHFEGN